MSKAKRPDKIQSSSIEATFPSVDLGGLEKPALDIDTVYESFRRNGGEARRILSDEVEKTVEAEDRDMFLTVTNNSNSGETVIDFEMEMDGDILHPDSYAESCFQDRIEKLFRREQATYHAATHFVHRHLPEKADDKNKSELEIMTEELERLGETPSEIAREYYGEEGNLTPSDLITAWGFQFEPKPYQDLEYGFTQEMPLGKKDRRKNTLRNQRWLKKYLGVTTELALETYGEGSSKEAEEQLRDFWLQYT